MTLVDFQSALASKKATPGGGTAAAVALGQAAGLTEMVCSLTLGSEKWSDGWQAAEIARLVAAEVLLDAGRLANEDSAAFDSVVAAFRMPKENEDEGPRTKKGKGNKNRDNKVTNDEQDAQAKLGHGMAFGEVFCREVRDGTNQPRMDDGTEMCNRFYGKGYCFQNCRRSHNKKNSAEQTRWKKFLQNVIARYKAKRDGREMPAPVTTSE